MTWHLETARLRLRPLEPSDADALERVLGDPTSMRFYPRPFDRSMTEAWIDRVRERYDRDGYGLLAICEGPNDEVIGDCGPMAMEVNGSTHVELGWHIRRDRQRLGFATEAGAACRDRAFCVITSPRLISLIRPENVPSWRVARRLGFHPWQTAVRLGMGHLIWALERPGPPVSP